jgi:sortase (surface protein transpeptidase)
MIRTAGYSCLTITSCHPIGISDHRIVVRGRLDEIFPYSPDYDFQAALASS